MNNIRLTRLFVLMISVILLLCSCGQGEQTPESDTPPAEGGSQGEGGSENTEPPKDYEDGSYTLLIYMCGSNLESRAGAATKNITEMLAADIPDNAKVIIQTGGAKKWRDYGISAEYSSRYELADGELKLISRSMPINMGQASTLSDFLIWADNEYPAENRSVILWNHGGGSLKGVCTDEQFYNDTLTIPELYAALSAAHKNSGRKYEFIGFDACLMATYDTACAVSSFADHMIASEELEPNSGWSYGTVVSRLGSDSYYTDLLRAYGEKHQGKATHTLSVIDLSYMTKVEDVISEIIHKLSSNNWLMTKVIAESKEFGASNGLGAGSDLMDLGLVAESLSINHGFDEFIQTANGSLHKDATGLSIYLPIESRDTMSEYGEIAFNQEYLEFLHSYFGDSEDISLEFSNPGYDNGGKFSFSFTPESEYYLLSVGYLLHSVEADGSNQYMGSDNDIEYDNGEFTLDFSGNWIYLNGIPIQTSLYSVDLEYTVFSTPVIIDSEHCYVLFTYFKPTRTVKVEGYVPASDENSRIYDIENGTQVTVVYEEYLPNFTVKLHEKATFTWEKDVEFSIGALGAGRYKCTIYAMDIYGNIYFGYSSILYFDGKDCRLESIVKD